MSMSKKKPKRSQAYWPVIGLVLAGTSGVFAWFLAPEVNKILARSLTSYPPAGVSPENLRLFMAGILFVVFVLLASLVVAASAPRKKSAINEKGLLKERVELVNDKKLRKLRQKQINRMNKSG